MLELDVDKKEVLVLIDDEEKTFRLEKVPDEEWIKRNIREEVTIVLRDNTVVQLGGV